MPRDPGRTHLQWSAGPNQRRRPLEDLYADVMSGAPGGYDLDVWHFRAASGSREYLISAYFKQGNPPFDNGHSAAYMVLAVDDRFTSLHARAATVGQLQEAAQEWDAMTEEHIGELIAIATPWYPNNFEQ